MFRRLFLIAVLMLLSVAGCQQPDLVAIQTEEPVYSGENSPEYLDAPYVLLISIDGYRHDYNSRYEPPNLTRFAAEGVRATSLIPGFPSDTFPNHYSIVTGMFPGTHGIVANNFFDASRNEDYRLGDAAAVTDGTWYGGTPIWSVAESAGMVAASYFWVGSEAEIAGERPSYAEIYNSSVPHADRISTVLEWLSYPDSYRPHFITLYFSAVDTAGHSWGPESDQVRDSVLAIDEDLGSLFAGLDALETPVNVFIVSDHGMVAPDPNLTIHIDDFANLSGMRGVNLGSKLYLYSDDQTRADEAFAELRENEANYRVFRTGDTPDAWHADNPRFGDIIVAADSPYTLLRPNTDPELPGGAHGYDPYLFPEMRGVFLARGPDLVGNAEIPSFSNVHIYPMIMNLLGLELPTDIDGRPEVLADILN